MLTSTSWNNGLPGHTACKVIALFQLLVLLALSVPVSAHEPQPGQEAVSIRWTAEAPHDSQDSSPCCPGQDQPESGSDMCSTCSYCNIYIPMTARISVSYSPSISLLIVPERFTSLPEVHIPIVVPPQNQA